MTTLISTGRGPDAPGTTRGPATGVDLRTEMLISANFRRVHAGARPLHPDARLDRAAQRHAADLAVHDLLQQDGTDGSSPWRRVRAAGFAFRFAAELVAPADSVPQAMQQWMHSDAHRAVLLDGRFTHLGLGYAPAGGGAPGRCVLTLGQV
ncbi:CAP domain-containing protein [Kitasatospora sp. NPDC089509]|uniref:CAP domain-containing protein n=1 Tax=Kitasatospora sp. NPDC089509 TaxID=3364079 RepID=UPI00380460AC